MRGSPGISRRPEPSSRSNPAVVAALLDEPPSGNERAWKAFLDQYSPLLLHVARRAARSYDERMNLYTHVITELRRDAYRRLRCYVRTDGAKFTTWLGVVARRLCSDYYRQRYGRAPAGDGGRERRRLEDLIHEKLDPELVVDPGAASPDVELSRAELLASLAGALECLEPRDRLMLTFHYVDGRTAREIAEVLRFGSQWQVYRRLESTLKKLRKYLDARGIHDATP